MSTSGWRTAATARAVNWALLLAQAAVYAATTRSSSASASSGRSSEPSALHLDLDAGQEAEGASHAAVDLFDLGPLAAQVVGGKAAGDPQARASDRSPGRTPGRCDAPPGPSPAASVAPVRPGGVKLQVAAAGRSSSTRSRQAAFQRGLDLAAVLAQLGRDERQAQGGVDRLLSRRRAVHVPSCRLSAYSLSERPRSRARRAQADVVQPGCR
jgi:hypothetical protein